MKSSSRGWLGLAVAGCVVASSSLAGTRFVGGGQEIGATAPIFSPFTELSPPVTVSQLYYTQQELQFAAGTRIIDVAWRKEDLGPVTGAGGCALQVWMKNVSRQTGPFTAGSTQALSDAVLNAQKVIDRAGGALPSTMGFVTLDSTGNSFSFDYTGDSLEVTVITDCRLAASPVTDAPFRWRYDEVPDRVRVATGATTDGLILSAEPILSSWRPHTRFRTLAVTPIIELQIAGNVLPNGGTFAVAPNMFAAGVVAPFAFLLVNGSQAPVDLVSLGFSGQTAGAASTTVTMPSTLAAGQSLALPVSFVPRGTALARFTMLVTTSAGNWSATFQGTPTATPVPQPSAALIKPDGTQQALSRTAANVVSLGNVPAGHRADVTVLAQNFGQGSVQAVGELVSGTATVVTPPTMVGPQQDVPILFRARAPGTPGFYATELRVTVNSVPWLLRVEGTVASPDVAVSRGVTDIPTGGRDLVPRPDRLALDRTYTVHNVGGASLSLFGGQYLDRYGTAGTWALPRVLPAGGSVDVVLHMPVLRTEVEPFTSRIDSDDPDERVFSWTTESAATGRPLLAVSYRALGFHKEVSPFGVSRGDTQRPRALKAAITLANNGDQPLRVTDLGEMCTACLAFTPQAVPFDIAPAENLVLERPFDEDVDNHEWTLSYEIASDDPDGPFRFTLDGKSTICSVAPGPLLVGLAALFWSRRRRAT